jgi:hypothetical protein
MFYCSRIARPDSRNYLENQQHNIGVVGNLHGELVLLLLLVLEGPMVRLIRLEFAGHAAHLHLLEGSQGRELLLVVLSLPYTDAGEESKLASPCAPMEVVATD